MHVIAHARLICYLDGPVQVRSLEAQVDLAADRQTNEQPVVETEVVNQLENITYTQVDQSHASLRRKEQTHTHTKTR